MKATCVTLFLCLAASVSHVKGFYIPGVSPTSYSEGQPLVVKVNALTSNQGVLPFPYYSFKTCMPPADRLKAERKKENLGELMWGDQIEPSLFHFEMLKNVSCRSLCGPVSYTKEDMAKLTKLIEQQYRGNLVMDNLPVAQETHAGPRFPKLLIGYPLGVPSRLSGDNKKPLINNHLRFTILYHQPDEHNDDNEEVYRIVGFYVSAHSVKYESEGQCKEKENFSPEMFQHLTTDTEKVDFTYSVGWVEEQNIGWSTRWDIYLKGGDHDDKIHWFSIINSSFVMLFLSAMVAMIMARTLHRDFNRYNDPENSDEAQEETGWKLVHADVFRAPQAPAIFAAVIGNGAQLTSMSVITLVFACLGFLSPSNRGGLLTAIVLLFVLLGSYAGYTSSRLCKYFKVQSWANAFLTGTMLPGFAIGIYLCLNLVQWAKHASSAIPFTTLLLIIALWFCVSVPLVIIGAAIGYKRDVLEFPTKVNNMPRLIPEQRWYLNPIFVCLASGILPFGAAFIELVYILSSFWQGRVYYVFGFLALVFVILVITCGLVAIVMVYFQLVYENYHWWWRSFFLTASSGLHLFLYSLYYLVSVLTIRQPSSVALYVGYMFLGSSMFALVTGTMGFGAAFLFVRKIYGSIKID